MRKIDANLCSHLMLQTSFQNIEIQKHCRNFSGDRLELWPSIYDIQTLGHVLMLLTIANFITKRSK